MENMTYNFDEIIDRRSIGCEKYSTVPKDTLPLWVADMDFKVAPQIQKTLEKYVSSGIFGYGYVGDDYYDAVIDWIKRRDNVSINKEWILLSPAVIPALSATLMALALNGEQVIIQSPVYNCFFSSLRNTGVETVDNQLLLDENCHYTIDFSKLEQQFSNERARFLLLCNPHNPAGRLWSYDELNKLALLCAKYNITVISDEIHCDIRPNNSVFYSMLNWSEILKDKLVVLKSASKAFNLAGLKNSYIIAKDPEIRRRIDRSININEICEVGQAGAMATVAAYNESASWLYELNDYIETNYQYLCNFIKTKLPKLKLIPLEATYLAWVDCRSLPISSLELTEKLLKEGKVYFCDGDRYGKGGIGFIRINLACPRSILSEALNRTFNVISKL